MDNLNEELSYVLAQLGVDLKVPKANSYKNGQKTTTRHDAMKNLSRINFNRFIERYQDDFDLFDFEIPSFEQISIG